MGCILGDPPSVVVLGVDLLYGMEALRVAPSEVLGGQCRAAAGAAMSLHGCALGVG